MAEIMPALIQRDSDFFEYGGQWIDGACPATALANVASSVQGRRITPLSVYLLMRSQPGPSSDGKLCEPSGAATAWCVWQAAQLLGLQIAAYRPYAEPWPDWQDWCAAQAEAGNVFVLETAYGQALNDSVTDEGENYVGSLFYHFFGGVSWLTGGTSIYAAKTFNKIITGPGLWSVDGDNWSWDNGIEWDFNCGDLPQFYDVGVLGNARLCAGVALVGKKAAPTVWTVQGNGTGLCSNGKTCEQGDMAYIQANNLMSVDALRSEEAVDGAGHTALCLENGTVLYWNGSAVVTDQGAIALNTVWSALDAANAEIKTLKAAVPAPTPTPTPAPIPNEYIQALAAVKAFSAAQAALSAASVVLTPMASYGSLSVSSEVSGLSVQ